MVRCDVAMELGLFSKGKEVRLVKTMIEQQVNEIEKLEGIIEGNENSCCV